MINLIIDLKSSQQRWKDFRKKPNAIAIDGYVFGSTQFDLSVPVANLNHHEEVDRLSTRATCSQMLLAIRTGLLDSFVKTGEIHVNVYTNDCDQDVCLSWFIIKNHWMTKGVVNPLLNKLVYIEDLMDSFAGSYPFEVESPIMREVAWIFKPYTQFRLNGGVDLKKADDYQCVIDDVCGRISMYLVGKGRMLDLDTRYEIVANNGNFALVKGLGSDFKMKLLSDGIKAYISFRKRSDGNYAYTIGKMSPFVNFNVPKIIDALNEREGDALPDQWGGANTVAGSPRICGSKLTPEEVFAIVKEITERQN